MPCFARLTTLVLLWLACWAASPAWAENGGAAPAAADGAEPPELAALRAAAEAGVATAQVRLGLLYQNGFGPIKKDLTAAARWFAKASAQDDADGDFLLGYLYQMGLGVATDTARAQQLLEKAAARGHPAALEVLARQTAERDPVRACALFDLAASRMEECDLPRSLELYAWRDRLAASLGEEARVQAMAASHELAKKTPRWSSQLFVGQIPEGEPAFSDEEALRLVEEVLPLVEKAAQRPFKRKPRVRVAGRAEVAASLKRDLVPQFRNLLPQAAPADIEKLARQEAYAAAPALLGKYGFEDQTLYLLPRNIKPLMALAGIPEAMTPAVTKILIAHELTHALQDQYLDLKKTIGALTQQEPLTAFNATIEGHAVFIADSVGTALQLDRETIEFARFVSAGLVRSKDPGLEMLQRIKETQFEQIYLGGKRFIEYQVQQRGRPRLWEVLENPPVRTSMIAVPESYSSRAAARLDYAPLLAGLERRFGDRPWRVQNVEIGMIQVQAIYANMDPARREALIPRIRHIQGLVVASPESSEGNGITFFLMDSPGAVAELIDALEDMARLNLDRLNQSPEIEVADIRFGDFTGVKADHARAVSFRIGPEGKAENRCRFWRIARGTVMVEIGDVDANLSDAQVTGIAEEVFQRYRDFVAGGKPATATGAAAAASAGATGRPTAASRAGSGAAPGGRAAPVSSAAANPAPAGTRPGSPGAAAPPEEPEMVTALALFKRNDYAAAREALRPLMKRRPTYVPARFLLAVMAARTHDFDKAWLNILVAEKHDPANPRIREFIQRLEKSAPRPRQ